MSTKNYISPEIYLLNIEVEQGFGADSFGFDHKFKT